MAVPNYANLAQQESAGSQQAAAYNTGLNRVNQYGPWGSKVYTQTGDPSNPQYSETTSLSPEQQALYGANSQISQNLLNTGLGNVGQVQQAFSQPFDTSGLPQLQGGIGPVDDASRQRVEQAIRARAAPQFAQARQDSRVDLLNSGIERDSDAYSREMGNLASAENDFRLGAIQQGGAEESRQAQLNLANQTFGNQARGQGIQEQAYLRQLPLNELNALREGNAVQAPEFGNYYTGAQMQGPSYLDAGIAQGNYDLQAAGTAQSGKNALLGGLGNLGGAAISTFGKDLYNGAKNYFGWG